MKRWARGLRQTPEKFMETCDFAPATWLYAGDYSALTTALKVLCSELEIIFDKSTTTPGTDEPGFHLYRHTEGLSVRLEFSLTAEERALSGLAGTRTHWLESTPLPPGDWVLRRFAELDKARLTGTDADIDKVLGDQMTASIDATDKATDAAEDEICGEMADVMITGAKNWKPYAPAVKSAPVVVPMSGPAKIVRATTDAAGRFVEVP